MQRCDWACASHAETDYHDTEWGVPARDDRYLFEMLTLEGAQAGLSWSTILAKRSGYRRAFADFDPEAVARFSPRTVDRLVTDTGIVRHRGKIESTVGNAKCVLAVQEQYGSLAELVWQVVEGEPRQNQWRAMSEVPAETAESKRLSRMLKHEGFRFVGPTTCYAFMQAVGMVNDHLTTCFRHRQVGRLV